MSKACLDIAQQRSVFSCVVRLSLAAVSSVQVSLAIPQNLHRELEDPVAIRASENTLGTQFKLWSGKKGVKKGVKRGYCERPYSYAGSRTPGSGCCIVKHRPPSPGLSLTWLDCSPTPRKLCKLRELRELLGKQRVHRYRPNRDKALPLATPASRFRGVRAGAARPNPGYQLWSPALPVRVSG
ncbi:hypothetical protein DFH09DRAFT_1271430 [Mycena vulgaris]|nr:hypothetical protein DFH09DRAFT_1271430 [Mycena vulgaris]